MLGALPLSFALVLKLAASRRMHTSPDCKSVQATRITYQCYNPMMRLQEEFDVERTEIINTHVRQRKDMTDIIAAMEQEFADMDNELRQVWDAALKPCKSCLRV